MRQPRGSELIVRHAKRGQHACSSRGSPFSLQLCCGAFQFVASSRTSPSLRAATRRGARALSYRFMAAKGIWVTERCGDVLKVKIVWKMREVRSQLASATLKSRWRACAASCSDAPRDFRRATSELAVDMS
eukprot:5974542-Pleurochrysis_carterae.AAC.3